MAGHVDTTDELIGDGAASDVAAVSAEESCDAQRPTVRRTTVMFLVAVSLALAALGGWIGLQNYRSHEQDQLRERYVSVARQAAVNLTTVSFTQVQADVARILDSATGAFRDDFSSREQHFVEAVTESKSRSEGTVTDAALESMNDDHGQVLVAVQVWSSTADAPTSDPRGWRMRIEVHRSGDEIKVSNVQFVP